ncbi:MAG: methyltransferase, partial [Anaerolineae bacterium]
MFPPIFPIYIPALAFLTPYATLAWFFGVLFLWLTRYTHQLGARWGGHYYLLSMVVRPAGILLILVGWLALYVPEYAVGSFRLGLLPRRNSVDIVCWLAIILFSALGVWSVATLGLRRSFLYRRTDDPLITRGPYRIVRHPQFLSAIGLTFFGIQLFNPAGFSFALYGNLGANWSLFALSLWVLALVEERELLTHFGEDYREYAQRVPRVLP